MSERKEDLLIQNKQIAVEMLSKKRPSNMPVCHYHDHYEIFYLLSGKRYYFINNTTHLIQKGDIVLINRNEIHRTINAEDPEYCRILINLTPQYIRHITHDASDLLLKCFSVSSPILRISVPEQALTEEILKKLLHEEQKSDRHSPFLLQAYTLEFLVLLSRLIEKSKEQSHPTASHSDNRLNEILQYVQAFYSESLTIEHITKQFHLSPYYFCHLIKNNTGFTFTQFLNTVRIREAQKRLNETNKTVTQIASEVGFDNVTHFCRVFKKITGISPLKYRQSRKIN